MKYFEHFSIEVGLPLTMSRTNIVVVCFRIKSRVNVPIGYWYNDTLLGKTEIVDSKEC